MSEEQERQQRWEAYATKAGFLDDKSIVLPGQHERAATSWYTWEACEKARAALSAPGAGEAPVGDVDQHGYFTQRAGPYFPGGPVYAAPQDLTPGGSGEAMPWHWIWEFLDGSAGFEGVHFGEAHPKHKGRFWWRSYLREALDAIKASYPADVPAVAVQAEPQCVIAMDEGAREPRIVSWNEFPIGTHQLYAHPKPASPIEAGQESDIEEVIALVEAFCAEMDADARPSGAVVRLNLLPKLLALRSGASAQPAEGAEQDAKRWNMLPAFFEEYQIDALKLYRDIDALITEKEQPHDR